MSVLALCEPIINGQAHHSYPLAIALSLEHNMPWFYNNYINLSWVADGILLDFCYQAKLISDNVWNTYKGISVLRTQIVNWNILSKCRLKMTDFLMNSIDSGQYVDLNVNEFYCPYSIAYKKTDYIHCILVYGYDSDAKLFNVLCYNKISKLSKETLTFKQIQDAFNSLLSVSTNELGADIYLISHRSNYCCPIDKELICQRVKDYLSGKNYYEQFRQFDSPPVGYLYGIDIYNGLLEYIKQIKLDENNFDLRIIHLLYEHKICMTKRVEYLQDHGYMVDGCHNDKEFNNLAENILTLKNLALKYNARKNVLLLDEIISKIETIRQLDNNAFKALFHLMKK